MKIGTSKIKKRARIEVIPLIDIMFFLLATFVLVSVSMTENRGLLVALPESNTNESRDGELQKAEGKEEPLKITVSILEDGTYALDKESVDFDTLKKKIQKLVEENPQQKFLTLMGDKASNLQNTVQVLDLAREMKIESVTIRTKSLQNQ